MVRFFLAALALVVATGESLAQDAAAGERVFTQCRACHQVGETARNGVGPVLNGLFGRKSGSIEGYSYSPANKKFGTDLGRGDLPRLHQGPEGQDPGHQDGLCGRQGRAARQRPHRLSQAIRRHGEEDAVAAGNSKGVRLGRRSATRGSSQRRSNSLRSSGPALDLAPAPRVAPTRPRMTSEGGMMNGEAPPSSVQRAALRGLALARQDVQVAHDLDRAGGRPATSRRRRAGSRRPPRNRCRRRHGSRAPPRGPAG